MFHTCLPMVLLGQLDIVVAVGSVGCYTTQFSAVADPKLAGLDLSLCGADRKSRLGR